MSTEDKTKMSAELKEQKQGIMRWSEEHDKSLLREVLVYQPYEERKGSVERKRIWDLLAESLNKNPIPRFQVTGRSVRDHLKVLTDNFKRKQANEEKSSGMSFEETEVDTALQDLVERINVAEERHLKEANDKKSKIENDMEKALEMRKKSMETYSESMERLDETPPNKKGRNNGSDTIAYLKEKSENEIELKRKELSLKEQEIKLKEQERKDAKDTSIMMQQQQQQLLERMSEQHNTTMQLMQQQMQNQQLDVKAVDKFVPNYSYSQ